MGLLTADLGEALLGDQAVFVVIPLRSSPGSLDPQRLCDICVRGSVTLKTQKSFLHREKHLSLD